MFTCAAGVRDGGGAETSGAPSPSEGNGAVGFGSGTGAGGVGAGAAGRGASAGARASEVPLRLPNTTTHSVSQPAVFISFNLASNGASTLPLARLASARPVST